MSLFSKTHTPKERYISLKYRECFTNKNKVIENMKKNVKILEDFVSDLKDKVSKNQVHAFYTEHVGALSKRVGSIGKVTSVKVDKKFYDYISVIKQNISTKTVYSRPYYNDYMIFDQEEASELGKSYYWASSLSENLLSFVSVNVEFKDVENKETGSLETKKSTVKITSVSLSDDFTGYTVLLDNPVAKTPTKTLIDRFGNTMGIGDLVVYFVKYANNSSNIQIGNITNITKSNTIYCKNIKFNEDDIVKEIVVKGINSTNNNVFRLTENIFNEITMLKLMY